MSGPVIAAAANRAGSGRMRCDGGLSNRFGLGGNDTLAISRWRA